MLSGAMDQLVPKEQMLALWEIVARLGEKKTPGGIEFKTGLERAKYMEFEYGGHSKYLSSHLISLMTTVPCI
jgi:hypothetical protein